jgi:zinc transporter ZupT
MLLVSGSVIGAVTAFLCAEFAGKQVTWILPFTSGGFIYIALCQVVPDILNKDTLLKESVLQMVLILSAVFIMHLVTYIE